ncbi:MAG TPA: hypothetical protein VHM70_22070 [Polyangiaceae bacterium]|jgi:hypothetical protein|nr:hypothetical protein [Polyangiaceae bacterium]
MRKSSLVLSVSAALAFSTTLGCGSEANDATPTSEPSADASVDTGHDAAVHDDADAASVAPLADAGPAPVEADAGGGSEPSPIEPTSADAGPISPRDAAAPQDGGSTLTGPSESDAGADADAGIVLSDHLCPGRASGSSGHAASSGFAGTEDDYFALYDVPCTASSECAAACEAVGGSEEMCSYSECLDQFDDQPNQCLPAPVWRNLDNIGSGGMTTLDSAEITLVTEEYQDVLLADEFELVIPEGSKIQGIVVELRRAADEYVVDHSIKLELGGEVVGEERAKSDEWSSDLEWITYGGKADLWGREWTVSDLMRADFGVGVALDYTADGGNTRAYVAEVKVSVYYGAECDQ